MGLQNYYTFSFLNNFFAFFFLKINNKNTIRYNSTRYRLLFLLAILFDFFIRL